MKKIALMIGLILIATLGFLVFAPQDAEAMTLNATLINSSTTEFNTLTPVFYINCTGDNSSYYLNMTSSVSGLVLNYSTINNATVTAKTVTTAMAVSTNHTMNATCFNSTAHNANTSDKYFYINARPTISAVADTPAVGAKLNNITFTITWADVNSTGTGTDIVTFYACTTNAFSGGACTVSQYGNSAAESDGSTTIEYTIPGNTTAGNKNYYIFARDDNNYDIASSTSGTFKVGGGSFIDVTPDEEDGIVSAVSAEGPLGIPVGGWIIIISAIGIVFGYIAFITFFKG